jgi:hypothetical protein
MGPRLAPLALVLSAVVADSRALHELAFYLLVAGVAVAAVSALSLFGELVELSERRHGEGYARLEVLLAVLGLICILVSAAARGHVSEGTAAPQPAISALVAAVAIYAVHAAATLYRPPQRD